MTGTLSNIKNIVPLARNIKCRRNQEILFEVSHKKLTLLIVGSNGVFNAGDDAILLAFLKWLDEQKYVNCTVFVCAKNTYLLSSLRDLCNVKVRLVSGFELVKKFFSSRFVLICGGDYLDDFGSFSTRARAFILLFSLAFVSRISMKKFLLVNNGFRAHSPMSLSFVRLILRLAAYVSVRDIASYKLTRKYKNVTKGFDTAVLLAYYIKNSINFKSVSNQFKRVGLSVTPFFSNFYSQNNEDLQWVKEFAKSLDEFLSHHNNVEISLFSFNTHRKFGDQNLIKFIINFLGPKYKNRVKVVYYKGDLFSFMKKLSLMDVMVCCKYHSILFSYIFRKPMIFLKYHPKTIALANEIGLRSNAVISLNDVFNGELSGRLCRLLVDSSDFHATLHLTEAENRAISSLQKCLASMLK